MAATPRSASRPSRQSCRVRLSVNRFRLDTNYYFTPDIQWISLECVVWLIWWLPPPSLHNKSQVDTIQIHTEIYTPVGGLSAMKFCFDLRNIPHPLCTLASNCNNDDFRAAEPVQHCLRSVFISDTLRASSVNKTKGRVGGAADKRGTRMWDPELIR